MNFLPVTSDITIYLKFIVRCIYFYTSFDFSYRYTGLLFYVTNIVCPLPPFFRLYCGTTERLWFILYVSDRKWNTACQIK